MDGVVPVRNKTGSNISSTSCYTEKLFNSTEPIHAKLNLYKNCEKNCSIFTSYDLPMYRSNRKKSFSSSLNNIDETESLDCQRTANRGLCIMTNCYSEKRQSDPLIRYAFTNKGFDIETNNQRYLSQYDVHSNTSSQSGKNDVSCCASRQKIRVRISDEWGRRIENSLDSQSDSFDFDDFWNFGSADLSKGSFHSDSGDAFNVIQNDEVHCPKFNKCEKCNKCGHKTLKTQFSTSFS